MESNVIQFVMCDFTNPVHVEHFLELQRAYMTDPMGDVAPHSPEKEETLISKLQAHQEAFQLFAKLGDAYIGLANCFYGFSTFSAKKLINIHDLVVLPDYRDLGVGRKMLEEIARIGRKKDCCKITLEVRQDNERGKHLYKSEGFKDCDPPMHFWYKSL